MTPDLTPRRPTFEDLVVQHTLEVDTASGGARLSVPLRLSRGREGVGPTLALSWSGGGSSPFGRGWQLVGAGRIELDTGRGVPRYRGGDRVMFGGGRLVPVVDSAGDTVTLAPPAAHPWSGAEAVSIERWRTQGGAQSGRFERWTVDGRVHWLRRRGDAVIEVYGAAADDTTRLADPDDPSRVAAWLIEAEYHPRGDAVCYRWRAEDFASVDRQALPERRRAHPGAQRYPDRVVYGNATSVAFGDDLSPISWHFEVVFDYGDLADDGFTVERDWPVRPDVGTTHRAGFEVRTRRRCARITMCHRFDALGPDPVMVASTELTHDDSGRLVTITERGHRSDGADVDTRDRPPLTMAYDTATWGEGFRDAGGVPACDAARGSWVDLYGEGVAGLLSESGGIWRFRRNEGGGRFGAPTPVPGLPRASTPGQLVDIDGDGSVEWVRFDGPTAGMQRFDRRRGAWERPRPFKRRPRVDAARGGVQFLDLTGDGRSDLVVDRDGEAIVYYPFLGKEGFGDPVRVGRTDRHGHGVPALDGTRPYIHLADMTGDGLTDVVEIRGGRVEYWPNMGHGRFGAGVVMADPPRLLRSHDKARVRLVDLDGAGAAGLLYIGDGELRYWPNLGGDRFGAPRPVKKTPYFARPEELRVLDLGDGEPRLAWHNPTSARPLRALALNAGGRPGMLATVDNGVGATRRLSWRWSADDLFRDRAEGDGWATRLPRHRPVVDALEVTCALSGDRQVVRYQWHDGEFDEDERTGAGFARVDVWEGDPVGAAHDTPGRLTRLWQHNGIVHEIDAVGAWSDPHALPLDPTALVVGDLPRSDVHRAALRQLRGRPRRREVYAVGATGAPGDAPLLVAEHRYRVAQTQGGVDEGRAAFDAYEQRRVEYTLDGDPGDARIHEEQVLAIDAQGAVTRQLVIDHPRRVGGDATQSRAHAILTLTDRTTTDIADVFEASVEHAIRAYEVDGIGDAADVAADLDAALGAPLDFGATWTGATPEVRLLEWSRTIYYDAARVDAADAGAPLTAPTLVHHVERAALPDGAADGIYGARVDDDDIGALDAGYRWVSEAIRHHDTLQRFHRVTHETAPDGGEHHYAFDYDDLVVAGVTDPTGVPLTLEHDLQAWTIAASVDGNDVREELRCDPLGFAIVEARLGSVTVEGVAGVLGAAPLVEHTPAPFATLADVFSDPAAHLGGASRATFYRADPSEGVVIVTLTREVHHAEQDAGAPVRVEVSAFDGLGRVRRSAVAADPGDAVTRDGAGEVVLDTDGAPARAAADPRWWVDSQTRYDHRGLAVEVFEPFFDTAPLADDLPGRSWGRDALTHYDALDRIERVDRRDGTYTLTEHHPWRQTEHDVHDTVADSAWAAGAPAQLALDQALADAGTPTLTELDPRGLPYRVTAQGAGGATQTTTTALDARGEPTVVTDPRGLVAYGYHRDMLGRVLLEESADAGPKYTAFDPAGRPSDAWDGRDVHRHWAYDAAGRLIEETATVEGVTRVTERRLYDVVTATDPADVTAAIARNTLGRLTQHYDDAGLLAVEGYDLAGEPLVAVRTVRDDYVTPVDWVGAAPVVGGESYRTAWRRDALGREVRLESADEVIHTRSYDRLGGLSTYTATHTVDPWQEAIVTGATYDARGRRTSMTLGNGVTVDSTFDPASHHLARLTAQAPGRTYFDLVRTVTPLGQCVHEIDAAHDGGHALLITGLTASSERRYVYDAFGRLVEATGRMHPALAQGDGRRENPNEGPDQGYHGGGRHLDLADAQAVERYRRTYAYDDNGNVTHVRHYGAMQPQGAQPRWTETKWVAPDSNRSLSTHDFGGPALDPATAFDGAGNCVEMPHLRALEWDPSGRLTRAVIIERADPLPDDADHYAYGGDSQRVRRVRHRKVANDQLEVTDVVYLPGCEIRRVIRGGQVKLERRTSGFTVEGERLGELTRWVVDETQAETADLTARRLVFRLGNPSGGTSLELDRDGEVLSYEEYFPYGVTAFVGGEDVRDVKLRTYRYRGKLRDDGTGLYYYGYRYYAAWIGNWISPDPAGPVDGVNLYRFVQNDPINKHDPDGLSTRPAEHDAGVTGRSTPKKKLAYLDWADECLPYYLAPRTIFSEYKRQCAEERAWRREMLTEFLASPAAEGLSDDQRAWLEYQSGITRADRGDFGPERTQSLIDEIALSIVQTVEMAVGMSADAVAGMALSAVTLVEAAGVGSDEEVAAARADLIEQIEAIGHAIENPEEVVDAIIDEIKTCLTTSDPEVVRQCSLKVTSAALGAARGAALKVDKKEVGPDGRDSKFEARTDDGPDADERTLPDGLTREERAEEFGEPIHWKQSADELGARRRGASLPEFDGYHDHVAQMSIPGADSSPIEVRTSSRLSDADEWSSHSSDSVQGRVRRFSDRWDESVERFESVGEQLAREHGADHLHEFPDVGSLDDFIDLIDGIVQNPDDHRFLRNGREAFWSDDGTIVIVDPNSDHGGSVYRPRRGKDYFLNAID